MIATELITLFFKTKLTLTIKELIKDFLSKNNN